MNLWSPNNKSGQFVPDADRACLDAQNIWDAADWLCAHIMPCKKDENTRF